MQTEKRFALARYFFSRRGASVGALAALGALVVFGTSRAWAQGSVVPNRSYDVVIANGRVMDPESGLDAVRNVGVAGGKIAAISKAPLAGKLMINAKGLIVASGFIDMHEHGQGERNYEFQAHDGVTTSLELNLEVGTNDVAKWYAAREGKSLVNFGVSVGHIPVRMEVMHDPGAFLPTGDAARRAATP